MSFKKGQKVVCIKDCFKYITKGRVYEITSVGNRFTYIRGDRGEVTAYTHGCFKPLSSVVIKDKDYEDLFI